MIDKAQVWVDRYIGNDPSQIYEGYRTDARGFICMAWSSVRPGISPQQMGSIARNISKDELKYGDVLNCDSENVALFAGWADGIRSQYIGLELPPSSRAIKRNIPYPYFGGSYCYHPMRYNDAC